MNEKFNGTVIETLVEEGDHDMNFCDYFYGPRIWLKKTNGPFQDFR